MNFIQRYFLSQRSLLNESFNVLLEDREGKNINKAEKWIKANAASMLTGSITPRFITQEVRNLVPNSRLADCKFLVGATRIYFAQQNANQRDFASKMNKLNKILKIIGTAHVDEYDNDLNGMSLEQLDQRFSEAVNTDLEADKEKIKDLKLSQRDDYKFVAIDSFEEAKPYGKYTEWCVTHHSDMYENYTKGGIGRFYFCLRDGFEDVPKEKTEGCPMDIYGKSMIAISVNDDGSLNTCTCRWNHDNGGNDNMMTTEEISKFFGVNFYETFKPRSVDEAWKNLLDKRLPDDEFCKMFGCIALESPDDDDIYIYKKLIDGKIITLPRVDDFTTYINGKFMTMKGGKLVEHVPEKIGNDAFFEDSSLTKIEIPHGVKSIGENAFCRCTSLTSITIPDSVESIENYAFAGCKNLKSMVIPDSVKIIGIRAFIDCISLTSVEIPDLVKSIGGGAFYHCTNLTSIVIPDSVECIGIRAFCYCMRLKKIEIPDSVESIGASAFDNCTSLTNIAIPDSVKSIGNHAFYKCISLTSIEIPDSVESIENSTFAECTSLTSIVIPDSVENIGDDAFYDCKSLKSIVIPDSVESIGDSAFYRCDSLEEAMFKGKTLVEVKAMENYPFGIEDKSVIKVEL